MLRYLSSSAPPRGLASDPVTFEYYAFALDAVSWASPSLQAPATLTLVQLQGIYNCTFTDWAQVGGGSGPIQRYFTQVGSGTGSFFQSDLLGGFDPTSVSTTTPPAGSANELLARNAPSLPVSLRSGSLSLARTVVPLYGVFSTASA